MERVEGYRWGAAGEGNVSLNIDRSCEWFSWNSVGGSGMGQRWTCDILVQIQLFVTSFNVGQPRVILSGAFEGNVWHHLKGKKVIIAVRLHVDRNPITVVNVMFVCAELRFGFRWFTAKRPHKKQTQSFYCGSFAL